MSHSSMYVEQDAMRKQSGGPNGLLIMVFMGLGMLAGILFLAWLGAPRIDPAVGRAVDRIDLTPLFYANEDFSERNLADKVTVLHFWGTWCPPCREEFPEFVKVAKQFAGNTAVQFVSISSSQGPENDLVGLASTTKKFLDQHSATVPTYADPAGFTRVQLAMLMPDGELPYPSTIVINQQGIVAGVWIGFSPKGMQEVSAMVRSLL